MVNNFDKRHIFFNKGDVVRVKQDIENRPNMVVRKINKTKFKSDNQEANVLLSINCFWFDVNGNYQQADFSTKDLEKA